MIAICFDIRNENFLAQHTDRGISEEAGMLSKLINKLNDSFSETVVYSRDLFYTELDNVVREHAEDDWDGYGAKAAQLLSCDNARHFINILPSAFNFPEISVDPDGEISFEWYLAPRKQFSISFGSNGELTYSGLFGSRTTHGTEILVDEIPKIILSCLYKISQ